MYRIGGNGLADTYAIEISVSNVSDDRDADDNTFNMFNDDLTGGAGGDLLIGDLYFTGLTPAADTDDLHISLREEDDPNTFNMFNDTLTGGDGADALWGDFLIDIDIDGNMDLGGGMLELDLSGIDVTANDTLFNDVIGGGAGADAIWGQLGDDTLTGDAGGDTFFFGTLLDGGSSGVTGAGLGSGLGLVPIFDGNDTITDYTIAAGAAGDKVDLDALFDALGVYAVGVDDRAEAVSIVNGGGVSVLTVQLPDNATVDTGFSITFTGTPLTAGGFQTFTDAALAAEGILVGV